MEGRFSAHGEVFCSHYCLRKFEEQKGLTQAEPCPLEKKKTNWASLIVKTLIAILGILFILGFFVASLRGFTSTSWHFIKMVAPAFALGLILAGLIDVFIPREVISSLLSQGKKSDIFKATAMGFLSATCSHGCLVLSMELHRKGASGPSVLAFLLASPWASLPVTILLIRLFGYKGIVIIFLAFIVAWITGFFAQRLEAKGLIEKNPHTQLSSQSYRELLKEAFAKNKKWDVFSKRFKEALMAVSRMTLPWVTIGIGLAALVQSLLSQEIGPWLGKTWSGPLLSMGLATVIEVCSEGSAPLAFGIYSASGAALGSAFAFLEAGVVTDFNEISLVWANLGKKSAWALILLSLPQVLFWGYILNWLF